MKSGKRTLLSFVTAFVMAFTVFGCTGASFAAGETDEPEAAPGAETKAAVEQPEEEEAIAAEEEGGASMMDVTYDEPVAASSVTLHWDAVEPATPGWTVFYVITGQPGNLSYSTETEENPSVTSHELTGLKANTSYTFEITAWEMDPTNPESKSEVGEPQKVEVKTAVQKLTVTPVSATGAYRKVTLKWKAVAPQNGTGDKVKYEIYGPDNQNAGPIKKVTGTSVAITGLSPRADSYTYYIKAIETNSKGTVIEGSESDKVAFKAATTTDFSKLKLSGLRADPGYKAVLLEWNRIDGATGYYVYWREGGERGNSDTAKCSDGRTLKTYKSKKTRKDELVKKPGKYKKIATVKNTAKGKVKYDKRGLKIMNHTYVYFHQFMIVPYYKDGKGEIICNNVKNKWNTVNKNTKGYCKTMLSYNIIKQNTVLPMYVLESAKKNKPIYKTHSMGDGKKRGRLKKGHKFICWDKADGRVKFYEKKNVSNPKDTFWFAQKNAHVIQGYYLNNGKKTNMKRKDYATGYSKKTVLDYVNHCGLKSKTNYFIWASKYAQHVYILKKNKSTGKWVLLNGGKNVVPTVKKGAWSNLCASGKVGIQSRNGHYVIFGKQYKAKRAHYDYYCISKLHSTVRLHTLLHKKGAKLGSNKFYNRVLGNPQSKGCFRMKPAAAQYVYKHVPKKTRTLVY